MAARCDCLHVGDHRGGGADVVFGGYMTWFQFFTILAHIYFAACFVANKNVLLLPILGTLWLAFAIVSMFIK